MIKEIITYSLISAFALTYLKWGNPYILFWNFLFAFIVSFVAQLIFLGILRFFALKKGYDISFTELYFSKETRKYSHLKKTVVKSEIKIPIGYILPIAFTFITYGLFFPATAYIIKLSKHPIFRTGTKEEKIEERITIFLKALFYYFIVLSIIYILFSSNWFLSNLYIYFIHFSLVYFISKIIPWVTILLPLLKPYDFEPNTYTEGDLMIMTAKSVTYPRLLAIFVYILLMHINIIAALVFAIIVFFASKFYWLYKELS